MASKKGKSAPPIGNPSFRGFLNINLTDEDKSIIKATKYEESEYAGDLEKWIDNGFKFTFSQDDKNSVFLCIGTRSDKSHEDYGILLTGRGSIPMKAFKQWVYMQTRLIGDASWTSLLEGRMPYEIDD